MTFGTWPHLRTLVVSALWGGSFLFVEVVVDELSPLTIVSLRVGLAALTLWVIALALGLCEIDGRLWRFRRG